MSSFVPVWPELEFGWRIAAGSIVGFTGAALGSVGGVGGGAIFVPMLVLIIGFDAKSAAAMSKCMIMGTAVSTVYYNLKRKHPTLNMPLIDYDLALLFQPTLLVGISVGVVFNVLFADWMITILLIILFVVSSTRSFIKGVESWKKESLMKQESSFQQNYDKRYDNEIRSQISVQLSEIKLPEEGTEGSRGEEAEEATEETNLLKSAAHGEKDATSRASQISQDEKVPMLDNIKWKQLSILIMVWMAFFAVQVTKTCVMPCSFVYWILNSLQVLIGSSVSVYQAVRLYKGTTTITSCGKEFRDWTVSRILLYLFSGILAGTIAGMLGIGGGVILTPLFLELGVPAQVASATSAFSMAFSASMSVVQYYILKRFPVPYSAYLSSVTAIAAFTGQHIVRKVISKLGRTSIIIFTLAITIFVSAICLGGVGVAHVIHKLEHREYMGFENLCH